MKRYIVVLALTACGSGAAVIPAEPDERVPHGETTAVGSPHRQGGKVNAGVDWDAGSLSETPDADAGVDADVPDTYKPPPSCDTRCYNAGIQCGTLPDDPTCNCRACPTAYPVCTYGRKYCAVCEAWPQYHPACDSVPQAPKVFYAYNPAGCPADYTYPQKCYPFNFDGVDVLCCNRDLREPTP